MSKVVILGGGVAGLSAAHELVLRGFEVEVYERNKQYYGGKARSIDYTHHGMYAKPLPGEHGFRFFPGFYRHVTGTMREIPYSQNGKNGTVYSNLVATDRIMIARYDAAPIVTPASFPRTKADIELLIKDLTGGLNTKLTPEEIHFFAERLWQLATSCTDRRVNDYERISWWDFTAAERFSINYRHLLVDGLTRTLVAARAELASTKTGGDIFLQLLYCMTDPSVNTDRVLNGPTNDKWLIPWVNYLKSKGVILHQGIEAKELSYDAKTGKITSATLMDGSNEIEVSGDYFLLAVPVEKAKELLNASITQADPMLDSVKKLATSVAWMNGIQFYLNQDVKINKGHVICSDSEWAITCISQIQFWKDWDIAKAGNGNVRGLLSVDISDWSKPGKFTTQKKAEDCTRDEVEKEVWAQLKNSLNINGIIISDDMKVDLYLDRDIEKVPTSGLSQIQLRDTEPLLVNRINSWNLRPTATSSIPNLYLASDYVQTNTDLATMEGANEAARRAVNGILDNSGSNELKCKIYELKEPFCFLPAKWYDQYRYNIGLPWTSKTPWWINLITIILGVIYLLTGFVKSLYNKMGFTGEAAFVITTMLLTMGFAALSAYFDWGNASANLLAFGMFAALCWYAYKNADVFIQRLLLFGIAAGFAELLADKWLVEGIHSLVYPEHEAMLLVSPAYMPFAWAVILIQVGYLGYLYSARKSMIQAFVFTFLLGAIIIPGFEFLAKYANWWHYVDTQKVFLDTPYYIILGEGLICFALPFVFRLQMKMHPWFSVIFGILIGLWIFVSYYLAHIFVG
ncbi:MAG: hydroxysqualene dehydroxylase [Bacteroidia bacterium]